MIKKLARKKFIITDDMALDKMSLVSAPAIEVGFQAFVDEPTRHVLAVMNPDQQIVTGPAMIANKDIYRVDSKTGEEYYGYFDAETIKTISENFLSQNKIHDVNVEHQTDVPGCFLIESWIVQDGKNDKANALGFSVNQGDWMVSYKINDPKVWTEIKDGSIKGFSIEGFFYERVMNSQTAELPIKQNNKTMSKRKMSIYARMKAFLDSFKSEEFADDVLADGTMVTTDKDWTIGANVMVVQPSDGTQSPITDGEYQLSDGTNITCVGGAITEVETAGTEPTEPVDAAVDTTKTDPTLDPTKKKEDPAVTSAATTPDVQAQLDALTKQVDELMKACGMKDEALAASEAKLAEVSASLELSAAEVVKLSAQPAVTTVTRSRAENVAQSFRKTKEDLTDRRIQEIAEMRKISGN